MAESFPEITGYEIFKPLGEGGMAKVYLANQKNFERKVAIKVMSHKLLTDSSFGERFLREARIVAQLSHRHIVAVYDVGAENDNHYIAMELLPGGDLKQKLRDGLSIADGFEYCKQIAEALNYAAGKGYIHRDIKPENILFREDGSAVVSDFGISRSTTSETQMTLAGTVIGTPHYMSPEQAQAIELDGRSDLYALGVMVFEIIVGVVPFDAESPVSIGIKHISEPIPRLPEEYEEFQEFIDIALAKNPDDRFQTGIEFIEALEELEDELMSHASAGTMILPGKGGKSAVSAGAKKAAKGGSRTGVSRAGGRAGSKESRTGMGTGLGTGVRRTRASRTGLGRAQTGVRRRTAIQEEAEGSNTVRNIIIGVVAFLTIGIGGYFALPWLLPQNTTPSPAVVTPTDNNAPQTKPTTKPAVVEPKLTPEQIAENTRKQQIRGLLAAAENNMKAGNKTSPSDDNALQKYNQVLSLDAANFTAKSFRKTILDELSAATASKIRKAKVSAAEKDLLAMQKMGFTGDELDALYKSLATKKAQLAAPKPKPRPVVTAPRPAPKPVLTGNAKKVAELMKQAEQLEAMKPRTDRSNNQLREIYLGVLKLDKSNLRAEIALERTSTHDERAIIRDLEFRNIASAEKRLAVIKHTTPSFPEIDRLKLRIGDRAKKIASANAALDESIRVIEEEYNRPGVFGSNKTVKEVMAQAYRRTEDARRDDPNNPRLDKVLTLIEDRYVEIIRMHSDNKDFKRAKEFFDAARVMSLPGGKIPPLEKFVSKSQYRSTRPNGIF